jgi:hypothetical protein
MMPPYAILPLISAFHFTAFRCRGFFAAAIAMMSAMPSCAAATENISILLLSLRHDFFHFA